MYNYAKKFGHFGEMKNAFWSIEERKALRKLSTLQQVQKNHHSNLTNIPILTQNHGLRSESKFYISRVKYSHQQAWQNQEGEGYQV
jgi:hypothetical protein